MLAMFPSLASIMRNWVVPNADEPNVQCINCENRHRRPMIYVDVPWLYAIGRDHLRRILMCHDCADAMLRHTDFVAISRDAPGEFWEFVQMLRFDDDNELFVRFPVVFVVKLKYIGRDGFDYKYNRYDCITTIEGDVVELLRIIGSVGRYIVEYQSEWGIDFDNHNVNGVIIVVMQEVGFMMSCERKRHDSYLRWPGVDVLRLILRYVLMGLFTHNIEKVITLWEEYNTHVLQ